MDKWLALVAETAMAEKLWSAGDTIIAAVSGGPDSTAMLHMLHRLAETGQLSIVAAHVDHGFRGEESARERESVIRMAARLGVPCESVLIDVPSYINETGMNAQAAAREKRYAFLHEIARKYGAQCIALAHHADDQAETVMMRILRGTSPGGLAGIQIRRREKNVELIRPLLRMNKADILSYCSHYGLAFSEDSSNAKRDYFRNTVRLDVLPALKKFNPQFPAALVRLSELAAHEDDWMEREAKDIFGRCVRTGRDGCQMNRKALLDVHVALQRRLIKLILNYVGMEAESTSFESVETVRLAASDAAASTLGADLGGGIRFVREYDRLRFLSAEAAADKTGTFGGYEYDVCQPPARLHVREANVLIVFTTELGTGIGMPRGRNEAAFDADLLAFPLVVRNRRPGDRMRVLGLNGTKKVQDMFVDERIPPSEREKRPLIADAAGNVIWIPGVRRSAVAPVSETTSHVLRIRTEQYAPEDAAGLE